MGILDTNQDFFKTPLVITLAKNRALPIENLPFDEHDVANVSLLKVQTDIEKATRRWLLNCCNFINYMPR